MFYLWSFTPNTKNTIRVTSLNYIGRCSWLLVIYVHYWRKWCIGSLYLLVKILIAGYPSGVASNSLWSVGWLVILPIVRTPWLACIIYTMVRHTAKPTKKPDSECRRRLDILCCVTYGTFIANTTVTILVCSWPPGPPFGSSLPSSPFQYRL